MADGGIGLWTVPLAVLGGAIRVSTPFLFVSLGECITERSGRINLGLEGTLFGALHAGICSLPRVNDIAVGIALMLFGTGLAFYLGKPLIEPTAPRLPAIDFGWWSNIPQVRAALRINVMFLIGVALAPILYWAFRTTRWDPMLCLWASLAFGGAAALGPALQSVGVTSGYHLFNAAPYILTLAIMIITCSPKRTLTGAPAELSITR